MRSLVTLLVCLGLVVIGLGAYTRLRDAGLGCPDWPGCYGQLMVPKSTQAITEAEMTFQQSIEPTKAWIEMVHRYIAGILGLGIITVLIFSLCRFTTLRKVIWIPFALTALVILQALLGRWTVTLKLYPPIILLHLLGGMMTVSLLWWYRLQLAVSPPPRMHARLKPWLSLGLILLLIQIALGGWVSANYAALICPDFPYCQGKWMPPLVWEGFVFSKVMGANNAMLVTIHMAHRLGAVLVGGYLLGLSIMMMIKGQPFHSLRWGLFLGVLVSLQITLGILNIIWLLPIYTAVTHHLVAALLLLTLLSSLQRCRDLRSNSNQNTATLKRAEIIG